MRSEAPFFSFGIRSNFLRRVRQVVLVGWVVVLIAIAPIVYQTLGRLSQMPSGPAKHSEVIGLVTLGVFVIGGPAFVLLALWYSLLPDTVAARLGITPSVIASSTDGDSSGNNPGGVGQRITRSRKDWMNGKTALARRLVSGECGGDYADALIILAAAISAIAADTWPGTGIDKKRFVQLLTAYADTRFNAAHISVPLLIAQCRTKGFAAERATLTTRYMNVPGSMILRGTMVDQTEAAISATCPTLSRQIIRSCSYASVFYTEVRSALAHQFQFGDRADPFTMAEDAAPDEISYGNWYGDPDRHIHFPLEWACGVADSAAAAVDAATASVPIAMPASWWLEEP